MSLKNTPHGYIEPCLIYDDLENEWIDVNKMAWMIRSRQLNDYIAKIWQSQLDRLEYKANPTETWIKSLFRDIPKNEVVVRRR